MRYEVSVRKKWEKNIHTSEKQQNKMYYMDSLRTNQFAQVMSYLLLVKLHQTYLVKYAWDMIFCEFH